MAGTTNEDLVLRDHLVADAQEQLGRPSSESPTGDNR
jgi:hypothetical protein